METVAKRGIYNELCGIPEAPRASAEKRMVARVHKYSRKGKMSVLAYQERLVRRVFVRAGTVASESGALRGNSSEQNASEDQADAYNE